MTETMRMWIEVIFNISYLIAVWGLVVAMLRHQNRVPVEDKAVAQRVIWMFALLTLGDTGHVGFRVLAYALGGLEANPLLVGLGALATAITVTFFYMLLVDVWRLRYNKPFGVIGYSLLAVGVIRLAVMALPGNMWGSVVPPEPMGIIRNIPLMVLGVGIMILILIDAYRSKDITFQWVGWCIFGSYLFYTPVILFTAKIPLLGMLMIPKTLMYIAIAVIVYRKMFIKK